jgi:hypothetical protein
MSALRRIAETLGLTSQPAERASPGDARDRLRQLAALRAPAEKRLADAAAARQRVRDLIAAADEAESVAADLEMAVATATREWAESGADPSVPAVSQALLDQRSAARRTADEAQFKAQGAEAALPKLAADERDARQHLADANTAHKETVGCVERAMIDDKRGERFARALRAWLVDGPLSLDAIMRPSYAFHAFNSREAHREIIDLLFRCGIRVPSDDEIKARSGQAQTPEMQELHRRHGHAWIELYLPADGDLKPQIAKWVALAQRLRTDPDAAE